jgi:ATP-dependent DNA helicase RecG
MRYLGWETADLTVATSHQLTRMPPYSDEELRALLLDVESDLAKRIERWAGDVPTKAREAVCAFANDLAGHDRRGVLFVGVQDDGTPVRLSIDDQLLLTLSDLKTDGQIVPPPTLFVEKRTLLGADVAVVSVVPSDSPPVSYKGRIHVRWGPRRGIASPQDERILNERRRYRDRPFDTQPLASATLSDLSRTSFMETYLPAAVAPDVLAANDRTYMQRLAATKMIVSIDEPTPTVLGILTIGTQPRDFLPGAYIQFLRIAGTGLSDPIADESTIDGTLTDVIRRIDEKIAAHNQTTVDITSASTERRTPTYPPVALQQLIRNAVMHRTYEHTNAPVRVTWYTDRIEISSPGGPFGLVTQRNFGEPGISDYRNPNIAEAMRTLGFVQRFGVGIATARAELAKNGNPPLRFSVEPTIVGVTVSRQ